MTDAGTFTHAGIRTWTDEIAALTRPDRIGICDGSEPEKNHLIAESVATGELIELNQEKLPGCYLHRSAPHDVARTEHLTFVCTEHQDDAGPNNNWMAPGEAKAKLHTAVQWLHGRADHVRRPVSDGAEGVAILQGRRRDHRQPLRRPQHADHDPHGADRARPPRAINDFTRCLHSLGDLSPDRRFIMHFPESNTVWSIGSGYGGNALLGKKCMALRLASWMAKKEGWLAEHMLILGLQSPDGRMHHVAGAFPSACGKTNLAMLVPPVRGRLESVHCRRRHRLAAPGSDGRLWAVNPEAGFFGVVPGRATRRTPRRSR